MTRSPSCSTRTAFQRDDSSTMSTRRGTPSLENFVGVARLVGRHAIDRHRRLQRVRASRFDLVGIVVQFEGDRQRTEVGVPAAGRSMVSAERGSVMSTSRTVSTAPRGNWPTRRDVTVPINGATRGGSSGRSNRSRRMGIVGQRPRCAGSGPAAAHCRGDRHASPTRDRADTDDC